MKTSKRLLSNAFVIEHEGCAGKERLILRDGTTMQSSADSVSEVKDLLRDADTYGWLPREVPTVFTKLATYSIAAFYAFLLLFVALVAAATAFHIPKAVLAIPLIVTLVLLAASGAVLGLTALFQTAISAWRWFTRQRHPVLFQQGPVRGELCAVEALRRTFSADTLAYVLEKLKWERAFQLRFYWFFGAAALFLISPYAAEVLKRLDVIQQYWMLAPEVVLVPFLIYVVCHSPILKLERASYFVKLAAEHGNAG